eukprot:gene14152-16277_t
MFSLAVLKVVIDHFRKHRQERVNRESTAPLRPVAQPLGAEAFADPGRNWQQKPPPPPPKKPWWSVYCLSLGMLIFVMSFTVGRFWFIYGNPPPQSLDELAMQTVDVVDWHINGSRLYVRLPSGVVQQVEFPSLDFKGPSLNLVITLEEQKALVGQRCQMWGRPLRRVLDERFQVFALKCDRGGGVPFAVAKKHFEITRLLLCLVTALALTGCATGPRQVDHNFSFDGWKDGWYSGPNSNVQLQEYSYGDQYHMVREKVKSGETRIPANTSVSGPMPVGEFLYVRWLLKGSGEMVEHRVDLRDRLPKDMHDHRVSFVIDGKDLYVYVVTTRPKPYYGAPPVLRHWLSEQMYTYEIYPSHHKF